MSYVVIKSFKCTPSCASTDSFAATVYLTRFGKPYYHKGMNCAQYPNNSPDVRVLIWTGEVSPDELVTVDRAYDLGWGLKVYVETHNSTASFKSFLSCSELVRYGGPDPRGMYAIFDDETSGYELREETSKWGPNSIICDLNISIISQ